MREKPPIIPVAIIGAGPTGIAAAIQLSRYNIQFLIFEGNEAGGLLHNAYLIENYPGFPDGISGSELATLFVKQLDRFGIRVTKENVTRIDIEESCVKILTGKDEFMARHVLVATGTRPKPIPVLVPLQARDRVLCEIRTIKKKEGKHVVIVGAGDAAYDYALNMAQKNMVTILNRGTIKKCVPCLLEMANRSQNINYIDQITVMKVDMESEKDILLLKTNRINMVEDIKADYLLFAIGREPVVDFLSDGFRKNEDQYLKSNKLIYGGDVINGHFRQSAIAAGDGLRAAMKFINILSEEQ